MAGILTGRVNVLKRTQDGNVWKTPALIKQLNYTCHADCVDVDGDDNVIGVREHVVVHT